MRSTSSTKELWQIANYLSRVGAVTRDAIDSSGAWWRGGPCAGGRTAPPAGRGVIVQDFGFRGNSAANRLRNFHDHGPGPRCLPDNPHETPQIVPVVNELDAQFDQLSFSYRG